MGDSYRGRSAWFAHGKVVDQVKAKQYLPKQSLEPQSSYTDRLARSPYDQRFRAAIEAFAGLLPIDSLSEDAHPTIEEYRKDIDLRGNNLDAFWDKADEMSLRDGFSGVLVEFPRQPRDENGEKLIKTAADEKKFRLRPYLCLIDRRDIISWRISYINGKMQVLQAVIRECRVEAADIYGEEEETYYRVLRPGSFDVWKLKKENEGKGDWVAELVEEGKTSLSEVPLVLYSATDTCPFEAEPPLMNLASLNLSYYQLYSDYRELIYRLCLPVPVRKGLVMEGQTEFSNLPPLVLGPNSCVDVPTSGDFFFAEPTGSALGTIRTELDAIASAMDRATLGFLSGDAGSEKTATEVQFRSGSTQASLAGMARMKESAIENVFRLWASYYQADVGGGATINKDILQLALDPHLLNTLSQLTEKKQLSLLTFLRTIKEGKVLPRSIDPKEELTQIQQQVDNETKLALERQAAMVVIAPPQPFGNQNQKGTDKASASNGKR